MSEVSYRWLAGPQCSDEEWEKLDSILVAHKWFAWDKETTLVRIAEMDGELIGFFPIRCLPHTEPLWVKEEFRGQGIADKLADDVVEKLEELGVKGWLAMASNRFAAKMCEDRHWIKIDAPVYMGVRV